MLGLLMTQSHSVEPKRPWNEYPLWEKFVDVMLDNFKRYQDVLVKLSAKTPTFFISYEQLITNPEPAVIDLFCFLLGVKTIEGTLVEHMVKKVVSKGNTDSKK